MHVALRERLFRLENICSTRNENEKNEIKLQRNIPTIQYTIIPYSVKLLRAIHEITLPAILYSSELINFLKFSKNTKI